MSQLLSIKSPDAKSDYTKSQSYFWLVGPLGFVAATAAVYKKSHIYSHWLFGLPIFASLLKYLFDLLYGVALGMIFRSDNSVDRGRIIVEKISKQLKKVQVACVWFAEEIKAKLGVIPQNSAMPDLWDRFTPDSQIKILEVFLRETDNERDRSSLEFWKVRAANTERKWL